MVDRVRPRCEVTYTHNTNWNNQKCCQHTVWVILSFLESSSLRPLPPSFPPSLLHLLPVACWDRDTKLLTASLSPHQYSTGQS